jgi:signal transduction histidine kinase
MIHGEHLQLTLSVAPGLLLPWDREDMLELLGNLLDNACKWADAQVELSLCGKPRKGMTLKCRTMARAFLKASVIRCSVAAPVWMSKPAATAWVWGLCEISSRPGARDAA